MAENARTAGGSTDNTAEISARYARVVQGKKGKAAQLNTGGKLAKGDILFFVHADMLVPNGALSAIRNQIRDGFDGGGFKNEFDRYHNKIKLIGRIMNLRFYNRGQSDRCIFYGDNGICEA